MIGRWGRRRTTSLVLSLVAVTLVGGWAQPGLAGSPAGSRNLVLGTGSAGAIPDSYTVVLRDTAPLRRDGIPARVRALGERYHAVVTPSGSSSSTRRAGSGTPTRPSIEGAGA